MDIRLTEAQQGELAEALQESAEIARAYRDRIADEDSIALLQDLECIARLLGIHLSPGLEPGRPEARPSDRD